MKTVGIDEIKSSMALEISAGRLSVIDDFLGKVSYDLDLPIKFDLCALALCHSGEAEVVLDDAKHTLRADYLMVISPDSVLERFKPTKGKCNLSLIIIAPADRFRSIVISRHLWAMMVRIRKNPVFKLNAKEKQFALSYNDLVSQALKIKTGQIYTEQVMNSLTDAFFYHLLNMLCYKTGYQPRNEGKGQGERVFQLFIDEVAKCGGKAVTVEEIADKLCVSTKYLARVVKDNSDMTPSQWITEYTIRRVIWELRHTNKTMKDIAIDLGFPNPSSFGTFFRRHEGVSPAAYRYLNR